MFFKYRKPISWVIGIIIFIILEFLFQNFANKIGLSTTFYFEGFEDGEYILEDDRNTSFGWFLLFLETAIAVRAGMFIYYGNFIQGIGKNGNLLLIVSLFGVGLYGTINTLLWDHFDHQIEKYLPTILYNFLDLVLVGLIGLVCFFYYISKKQD